jgi:hypothetical protein
MLLLYCEHVLQLLKPKPLLSVAPALLHHNAVNLSPPAGLVWWQRGQTFTLAAATDKLGLLFFVLLFPSMRALFHALFTFPNEYRMLMKVRGCGWEEGWNGREEG